MKRKHPPATVKVRIEPEKRVALGERDFRTLVGGGEVLRNGVRIILQEIGHHTMREIIEEEATNPLGRFTRREFGGLALLAMLTGSKCFPGDDPPKDEDWLVFTETPVETAQELEGCGWMIDGSLHEDPRFVSLTKDGVNLILTHRIKFIRNWIRAHDECVADPPANREGRIKIFRKHLYCGGKDE